MRPRVEEGSGTHTSEIGIVVFAKKQLPVVVENPDKSHTTLTSLDDDVGKFAKSLIGIIAAV